MEGRRDRHSGSARRRDLRPPGRDDQVRQRRGSARDADGDIRRNDKLSVEVDVPGPADLRGRRRGGDELREAERAIEQGRRSEGNGRRGELRHAVADSDHAAERGHKGRRGDRRAGCHLVAGIQLIGQRQVSGRRGRVDVADVNRDQREVLARPKGIPDAVGVGGRVVGAGLELNAGL